LLAIIDGAKLKTVNIMGTKTKVEITEESFSNQYRKGDIGYIDGYVQSSNGLPYAVVVCGEKIELVPIYALKVIV